MIPSSSLQLKVRLLTEILELTPCQDDPLPCLPELEKRLAARQLLIERLTLMLESASCPNHEMGDDELKSQVSSLASQILDRDRHIAHQLNTIRGNMRRMLHKVESKESPPAKLFKRTA